MFLPCLVQVFQLVAVTNFIVTQVAAIGERMEEEEERLAERARELRRFFFFLSQRFYTATPQKKHGCVPVCDRQPGDDYQGRECQVAATLHFKMKHTIYFK